MTHGEVTFIKGGRTFRGHFETVGHDDVKAVSLRFGGRTVSAALGHGDPERIAQSLLGTMAAGLPLEATSATRSTH